MEPRRLVITADDFGLDQAVNEAVEISHRRGILSAASLMVAGPAVADAVQRARGMSRLRVGLHIVLVDGRPILPATALPDLATSNGGFSTNMAAAAATMTFLPAARRQLAAEIEAQFAAFVATGLTLDHVNAHKHFHLHPTIAGMILGIGARYGMRSIRAPIEPAAILRLAEPTSTVHAHPVAEALARNLRTRARRAGMVVPDQVFGLRWSGAMNEGRLKHLIRALPQGLSEIYLHPATRDRFEGSADGYAYRDELAALTSPGVARALSQHGARLGGFADFGR